MHKNLLHIVKSETSKYYETAIEPDVFGEGECTDGSCWEDERSESGNGDEGNTSEEWSSEVKVFICLGCCSDEGDGAHHGDCVQTGASNESRRSHEEERGEEGTLSSVECSPESVLLDVAF